MRINLEDVAKEAKVSTITASRAFSKPELLAPKTRTHVLQVAKRLGYVPNRAARSLRNGKTQTIAVLTTDLQQRLNTLKLDCLQREIMRQGYHTLLLQYESDLSRTPAPLAECRDMIDGLVLCCLEGAPSLPEIRALRKAGIPVVSLEYCSGMDIDVITADREFGSYLAVEHLRRLGHTQIALGQILLNSEVVERRALGYQCAMQAAGLEPKTLSRPGNYMSAFEEGYLLMQEARERGIQATAWLFSDDEMAIGAMRALEEWGMRIPEDVAIIGWDNSPFCAFVQPRLTSVTQPIQECVTRLVERLLKQKDAPALAEVTLIRPELVVRESCGAAS